MGFFAVKDVSIQFGGLKALDGISFEVQEGEVYAIIGPNGAGKTTLFNCINGIYKPNSGEIVFRNKKILGKSPDRIARLGIARTGPPGRGDRMGVPLAAGPPDEVMPDTDWKIPFMRA